MFFFINCNKVRLRLIFIKNNKITMQKQFCNGPQNMLLHSF